MDRRDFFQFSFMAAAGIFGKRVPRRQDIVGENRFYRGIFSLDHEVSQRLASDWENAGLWVTGVGRDITKFWYEDLSIYWQKDPKAICGITSREQLFCFEQLAWRHRLKVRLSIPMETAIKRELILWNIS